MELVHVDLGIVGRGIYYLNTLYLCMKLPINIK